ncbi:MAG TPA: hypothetical protein DER33_05870 [Syntrophomonas sp.]|nr:hypothetical protein [Syntrophomonas sp.]
MIIIYKKSICIILFLVMVLFSGCEAKRNPATIPDASPESTINSKSVPTPTEPSTDGDTSESNLVSLLKHDNLKVSEDLISQFFKYYRINYCELSLLPTFNSPDQADWDQFSLYIYRNFIYPKNDAKYDNTHDVLTKEKFAKTVNRYFGQINYTDRGSLYLTYENGIYTRKPGDETGGAYYRLTDISKDANGIYTAVFDALLLGEGESSYSYEESTPNIKAIRDAAGTKEPMQSIEEEKSVIGIFLKPNYNQILKMAEKVKIQFTLSGDDDFPFIYKSCNKTEY